MTLTFRGTEWLHRPPGLARAVQRKPAERLEAIIS
jgi:hypothetical protein